jgi:hypothetical protein
MPRLSHAHLVSRSFSAPTDLPPEGLLTVAEAANAANLTISQVWARIKTGKLRAHRITPKPLPPPPPKNKRGPRPSTFIDRAEIEALIGPGVKL